MKLLIVLCLAAVALGNKDAETINYQHELNEDGSYTTNLETTNGIKIQEEGTSYPGAEPETGNYVKTGTYSYIGDDGVEYTVTWTADENGFQAQGDHIPQ